MDYFRGLVQGSKPPPLTMLSPAGSKLARNTATVPPLNQVSPSNGLTSVCNNSALNATRTSSFAAALRKLAYQAKDPADDVIKHSSPNSSNSSPRSTTPKRAPPPLVYSSQSSTLTSPPVVTIAPTPSHQSALASDMRHGLDRIPSAHSTSSNYEPLALKQERDQRPLSRHSREDDRLSKDGQSLHSARITPHSNPGASLLHSGREDSYTRGFQPYRHGEELRPPVPTGFGMDPAYAAYHSALLASHYSHPAYRFEDPLLLERYRMMQPSFMPFNHPGMMPHPGVHPMLAGGRYPPELLHQYPYMSPSAAQGMDPRSPALSAERARLEEERQREIDREKEKDREKEREKEKWREKEREKEAAQRMREHDLEREKERLKLDRLEHERREYLAQNSGHDLSQRSEHHREDLSATKFGSITQGTPRDVIFSDKYKQPHHSQIDYKRSVAESRQDNHHKTSAHLHESRNLTHHRESSRNTISVDTHRRYEHNHRLDSDHLRGHPPPLISPKEPGEIAQHRPDNGLFRPFEKESRTPYPHLEVPKLHNRKTELTVPPLKIPQREANTETKHISYLKDHSQTHSSIHGNMVSHASHSNHSKENYSLKRLVNDINKNNKMVVDEVSHDAVPNHVGMEKPKLPVSKLDQEEERLRKARLSGSYVSEDEDDDWSEREEDRIERMMLIRNGPPLPLDKSPTKIKFLSRLGLYTIQKKKDKEFERFKKRRKIFRETSLSPITVEDGRKLGSPLTIPKIDPDYLCIESDYPTKCSFLSSFNLQQLERDKRKELCMIREACVLEKKRRLGIDDSDSIKETSIGQSRKDKGVKRKRGDQNSIETNQSEPVKMTLGQLQQRHLAAQQKVNNIHNKATDNRAVIFPEARDRGRILSREFAEQFHESVLQTTRQKELASRLGNSRSDEGTNQTTEHSSSSQSRYQVPNDGIGCSSLSDQSDNSSYKWPGITAVMEAYQRHAEEQKSERDMLSERCKKLQSDNRDLNRTAEKLSNRMSSLLEQKQQYDDDRNRTQSAIENLKKSLRCLR